MDYDTVIELIISFKENIERSDIESGKKEKIPKKLVADLGEFYCLKELSNRFKEVQPKGGQGSYDICVGEHNKRIEVKTSTLKNDGFYDKNVDFWGWTVSRQGQKKEHKFDILIGVALDDSWRRPEYYIFNYEEAFINNSNVELKRFKSIQKKIHIFQDENDLTVAQSVSPDGITENEGYFNRHKSEFLNGWDKICRD
ncbi:hypothetical protein L0665_00780 [Methanogenium marinum]|uniref:Uncharacterized protein n=1 Tax=Methanogenium marinum TaxID=348610 RepID=A0A9Q4KS36_9EURY|nr:hypothetical protein [Methanogenium marinum]MDE4907163.1 hypothetical protein [Methanogenium marinum]